MIHVRVEAARSTNTATGLNFFRFQTIGIRVQYLGIATMHRQ